MNEFLDKCAALWALLKNYITGIASDWTEGRKARAVGKVILPLAPVAALAGICVLVWKYREAIYSGLILVVAFVAIIGYFMDKRAERKNAEEERRERLRQEAIRENARTADATYTMMGKVVYKIACELGSPDIIPPTRLSAIYSPGRMVLKNNGAVQLGLYLLQKSGVVTIDEDSLADLMQTKVDQMLESEELPEIPQKIIYHGRAYSGFMIHKVRDSGNANFVEVYTVLTNESYLRYKLDGELDKDTPAPSVDRRDINY